MAYYRTLLLALTCLSSPALAAECLALKAMSGEPTELMAKRDNIQRSEWLLLEYLSSEKSTRKVFDAEVAKSMERMQTMAEMMSELASLSANGQPSPEEGTAECAKFDKFKRDIENMVAEREKEIAAYHKQFGFLYSCQRLSQALIAHNKLLNSAEATPKTKGMSATVLEIGTGPFQMSARVTGAHMAVMTQQAEAPLDITEQQRFAYFAFSCLKRYQKQDKGLKPPAEIEAQLNACPSTNWTGLGMCVSAAALPRAK